MPNDPSHPATAPRVWECRHCHAAIGHVVREHGTNILHYHVYLYQNRFCDRRIDRRVTLPCPFCGEFTEWYPEVPTPSYDFERIERDINCLKSKIDKVNEESHEC